MSDKTLPTHARVIIVGGGVIGCSIAYHLAKLGWRDVVLLERKQLTSGTTWHAAGLLTTLRDTETQTRLAKYTLELYRKLGEETGQATGLIGCGSIQLAMTPAKAEEMYHPETFGRTGTDFVRRPGPGSVGGRCREDVAAGRCQRSGGGIPFSR